MVDENRMARIKRRMFRGRPLCEYCLEAPATDLDHIIPVSLGGSLYDASNLQVLCHECHSKKTQAEAEERRRNSG